MVKGEKVEPVVGNQIVKDHAPEAVVKKTKVKFEPRQHSTWRGIGVGIATLGAMLNFFGEEHVEVVAQAIMGIGLGIASLIGVFISDED